MTQAELLAPAAAKTLAIGHAQLAVRDLDMMTNFYTEEFGLGVLAREGGAVTLGADKPLLVLRHDAHAKPPAEHSAGLFHIAYLLPSRLDLARWWLRATANGLRLDGASDHLVSEALYLSDPEGNGIEVYADRPQAEWSWGAHGVVMATKRLDLRALAASAEGECAGFVPSTTIGHMHLKVGDAEQAGAFWTKALGLHVTARRAPHAVFMAAGKYHHHVAVNTWDSQGTGLRAEGTTGLDHFTVTGAGAPGDRIDPWGNRAVVR